MSKWMKAYISIPSPARPIQDVEPRRLRQLCLEMIQYIEALERDKIELQRELEIKMEKSY